MRWYTDEDIIDLKIMFDPDLTQPPEKADGGTSSLPPASDAPAPPIPDAPKPEASVAPPDIAVTSPLPPSSASAPSIDADRPAPGSAKSSFGTLLKRSFTIYKAQWWKFILLALFPVLVFIGGGLLVVPLVLATGMWWFAVPLGIVAYLIISGFAIAALHVIADGEKGIGFKEAVGRGMKDIFPWIWLSLLTGLVTLGGSLLIIPGIIWSVSFALAGWVFIVERKKGMDALLGVRQLVKGDWWRVALNLFALMLLTQVFVAIIAGIAKLMSDTASAGGIVFGISTVIQVLFITPITLIFTFAIYEDFKKWKTPSETPKRKIGFVLAAIAGLLLVLIFQVSIYLIVRDAAQEEVEQSQATSEQRQQETLEGLQEAEGQEGSAVVSEDVEEVVTEPESGTDDVDEDGLAAEDERTLGTDPFGSDTDFDGLADGDEVHVFGTDPLDVDSDGDGFTDGDEIKNGFHPLTAEALTDADIQAWRTAAEAQSDPPFHEPTITFLKDSKLFD